MKYIEVLSGLSEGDIIVASAFRANNTTSSNRTLPTPSPFRIAGFGGFFR